VIDGLHVIDSIASVKTGANDRPVEDVAIESMTELKALSLKAFNKKYPAAKK
jgi:hypothetical protein